MKSFLSLVTIILMTGCSASEGGETAGATTGPTTASIAMQRPTSPPITASPAERARPRLSRPDESSGLIPGDSEFTYVGRWAATPALCTAGAWRFELKHLSTAGEVSCEFSSIQPVPGGYDIAASCLADGRNTEEKITLRLAADGETMTVESKTFPKILLVRCPEKPSGGPARL